MKVYFIGSGPGDPELLTIKAAKIIKKADVIIYAGSLVNKAVFKSAKRNAHIYNSASMDIGEILGIMKEEKYSNKIIARLHSGDTSIYSSIQEQAGFCEQEGIEYEIIPGISSFQAAASHLAQELTLPGISQTVILTRISGRTKVPKDEDLAKLAKTKSTMVIFLSIDRIDMVIEKLKKGYGPDTPVAVVEKVCWPDERRIIGTLRDIAAKVKEARINRQALIVVGEVLKKKHERSKLYDKNFAHGFRKKQNSCSGHK